MSLIHQMLSGMKFYLVNLQTKAIMRKLVHVDMHKGKPTSFREKNCKEWKACGKINSNRFIINKTKEKTNAWKVTLHMSANKYIPFMKWGYIYPSIHFLTSFSCACRRGLEHTLGETQVTACHQSTTWQTHPGNHQPSHHYRRQSTNQ